MGNMGHCSHRTNGALAAWDFLTMWPKGLWILGPSKLWTILLIGLFAHCFLGERILYFKRHSWIQFMFMLVNIQQSLWALRPWDIRTTEIWNLGNLGPRSHETLGGRKYGSYVFGNKWLGDNVPKRPQDISPGSLGNAPFGPMDH